MKSAAAHPRVVGERFVPKISSQLPGAVAADDLKALALTTPFGRDLGALGAGRRRGAQLQFRGVDVIAGLVAVTVCRIGGDIDRHRADIG